MPPPLNIAILAYAGVQILDVTGPAAVFAAANQAAGNPRYRLHVLSPEGGEVSSNCGLALGTQPFCTVEAGTLDTVLVAGGDAAALRQLARHGAVAAWLREASTRARRFGSICTGVFLLAHLGLVDGKRVATHWQACSELSRRYPQVQVDANALYVEDGRVWTSAGVTTGIDMALALVERDLGAAVAGAVARGLVLYARRPGYQSQFSSLLMAQAQASAPFSGLIDWIRSHLSARLDVPTLAARMSMSDRSFHRKFTQAVGDTPARFVETLRLEEARSLLAAGAPLKEIAARTGYATAAQFSKAFDRRFGMAPALFRDMHAQSPAMRECAPTGA
ncbi:GlxA family transcriptional regulator [Massilia sp. GCM10023247]|uniref:GlxA family transcriptional regulator n=1 Tax=Massilia sp. GCM10023247 TaxID=3252643 RepID=UPI003613B6D1